jgi:hypothetical protein
MKDKRMVVVKLAEAPRLFEYIGVVAFFNVFVFPDLFVRMETQDTIRYIYVYIYKFDRSIDIDMYILFDAPARNCIVVICLISWDESHDRHYSILI